MAAGHKTGGRAKGTPNKITADLKRAILEAAEAAGGEGGTAGYLTRQADENPAAFMTLLGKVLPTTLNGPGENGEHLIKATADEAFTRIASRLAGIAPGTTGSTDIAE